MCKIYDFWSYFLTKQCGAFSANLKNLKVFLLLQIQFLLLQIRKSNWYVVKIKSGGPPLSSIYLKAPTYFIVHSYNRDLRVDGGPVSASRIHQHTAEKGRYPPFEKELSRYFYWEESEKVFPFEKVEYFPTFWFEKALRRFSFWEGLEKHGTITE